MLCHWHASGQHKKWTLTDARGFSLSGGSGGPVGHGTCAGVRVRQKQQSSRVSPQMHNLDIDGP